MNGGVESSFGEPKMSARLCDIRKPCNRVAMWISWVTLKYSWCWSSPPEYTQWTLGEDEGVPGGAASASFACTFGFFCKSSRNSQGLRRAKGDLCERRLGGHYVDDTRVSLWLFALSGMSRACWRQKYIICLPLSILILIILPCHNSKSTCTTQNVCESVVFEITLEDVDVLTTRCHECMRVCSSFEL